MAYIGTSISSSPTITGVAAADIKNGGGLAVKFNAEGKVVVCSVAGEAAIGFIILQANDDIKAGESITIQVYAHGKGIAGGAITQGDALTVDAAGKLTKAASGNSIIAIALSKATLNGFVDFMIDRSIAIA